MRAAADILVVKNGSLLFPEVKSKSGITKESLEQTAFACVGKGEMEKVARTLSDRSVRSVPAKLQIQHISDDPDKYRRGDSFGQPFRPRRHEDFRRVSKHALLRWTESICLRAAYRRHIRSPVLSPRCNLARQQERPARRRRRQRICEPPIARLKVDGFSLIRLDKASLLHETLKPNRSIGFVERQPFAAREAHVAVLYSNT
jgi:hypothetical protein